MGHGPLAAGGSYYYADLVLEGLRAGGGDPTRCRRALDFGCSSGRVVRVLGAAFPEIEWHACDPNGPAIAWARDNLSTATFDISSPDPPLGYPDGHFDLVFAISIWSHYNETAAAAWLGEMRRVVRDDGHFLLTAHGYQSLAHYARARAIKQEHLARAIEGMYARGFWFARWFPRDGGDHGAQSDDWGTAFLTPEWLLTKVAPDWTVVGFEAGRAEGNQDVYVLQRRDR